MLATRMFFWWSTALVDPLKPTVIVSAKDRPFVAPARTRVFAVPGGEPGKG